MNKIDVTLELLRETKIKIGFTLNDVRKVATDEELRKICKEVLRSWKKLVKEGGKLKLLKEEGGREKEGGKGSSSRKPVEVETEPAEDEKGRRM